MAQPGDTFAERARRALENSATPTNTIDTSRNQTTPPTGAATKLKPSRTKGAKVWKPFDDWKLNAYDSSGSEYAEIHRAYDPSLPYEPSMHSPKSTISASHSWKPNSMPAINESDYGFSYHNYYNEPLSTQAAPMDTFYTAPTLDANIVDHTTTSSVPKDEITEVFGERLPDPIFLSQVLGSNDGEVKFIQHPNRDVSAHQWDAAAFQWINIGGYSNRQKKIVGQLASDRLRGQTVSNSLPPNSLLYFRAVAKQRERATAGNRHGQSDQRDTDPQNYLFEPAKIHESAHPVKNSGFEPVVPARPTLHALTSADRFGSLSSASESAFDIGFPTLGTLGDEKGSEKSRAVDMPNQVRPPDLPDPFVMPQGSHMDDLRSSVQKSPRSKIRDLKYMYPPDLSRPKILSEARREELVDQRKRQIQIEEMIHIQQDLWSEKSHSQAQPKQVERPSYNDDDFASHLVDLSLDNITEVMDEMIKARGEPFNPQKTATYYQKPQPLPDLQHHSIRHPGQTQPGHQNIPDGSRLHQLSLNASISYKNFLGQTQNLQMSDPEPQKNQNYDIVSGLDKEPPTPQNWRGGFFKNTVPTAHEPSNHLSHKKTYEEELDTWWTSGQLYDRQESFYNTTLRTMDPDDQYKYSPITSRLLIPVYENLAAYVHQPRGTDYFARFRQPEKHLLDLGPNGNNSFFSEDVGETPPNTRVKTSRFGPFR